MVMVSIDHRVILVSVLVFTWSAATPADLRVANPSFEADRFDTYPGYADQHGGTITGWEYTGTAGINPSWEPCEGRPDIPRRPFADNGQVPHGKQVALMQNRCTLRQTVDGFEAGKSYQVTYAENARYGSVSREPPALSVTLGGETVVSSHRIEPIEKENSHTLPYDWVESAVFEAPADGAHELTFTSEIEGGVTVLIDNVAIRELEKENP